MPKCYRQRLAAFSFGLSFAAIALVYIANLIYTIGIGMAFAVAVCGILLGD